MPRAPSANKRQQGAANHRDTRHENGLVGPGKKITKQKSNGHINGNGHAKSSESLPSHPPLPSTPPPTNGHARQPLPAESINDSKMPGNGSRRPSMSGYSEESSSESFCNPPVNAVNAQTRVIDVTKDLNPDVHRDSGLLSLALTIIKSCPLFDTIAILIVLLQLPPTVLTIIHLLFATLTFVPPSTPSGGITVQDILHGTLGTPSVPVMVIVDMLVLLVYIFLWKPIQDLALDLAQSVIALTLGGGTSGREAGLKNVLVSLSVIGASHFARKTDVKQSGLRALISSSTNGLLGSSDPNDPLEPLPHTGNKKGPYMWLRYILGIHILTQGLVRYIRDWYVRRERRDNTASVVDPEAANRSGDTANDTSNSQTPDADAPNLHVSNALVAKKKRKHSAQVRVRQPLWAALASTKIVVVKEYETSHAAVESAGTNATDINNLGNAPFDTEADRIWLTHVGSDSVCFSTSYFPTYSIPENCDGSMIGGIDKSKPFYVRVNFTAWQPTRAHTMDSDHLVGEHTRWEGEIFGLAPMSSYCIEFLSTVDDTCIFTTRVRTRQPLLDASIIGLVPTGHGGRPGSPTTTLKASIAAAESKLLEEKARQKRERKDQRAKLNNTRKEIEKLTSSIASSGGNDERSRQRIHQSTILAKQAEDAIIALQEDIESLSALPSDDASGYKNAKSAYNSEKDTYKHARDDFTAFKQANDHEIQKFTHELLALEQKQEKTQSRIKKLIEQHDRITDANAKGMDEAQRRESELQRVRAERASMETLLLDRYDVLKTKYDELIPNLQTLTNGVQSLQQQEAEIYAAQAASPTTSVPALGYGDTVTTHGYGDIPEGVSACFPANSPWNPTPNTAGLYASSTFGSAMLPSSSQQGVYRRGRSSSMLSTVSGFTQSSGEDQYWIPEDKMTGIDDRKDSNGSASTSGSGSGAGSVQGQRSPVANGKGKMPAAWTSAWDEV